MDKTSKSGERPNITVSDVVPAWKEWSERLTKFFSFLHTRRAVLSGAQIWEMPKEDLTRENYLEPWAFNLYQSALSAVPTAAMFFVLHFFGLRTIDDVHALRLKNVMTPDAFSYLEKVTPYLHATVVPLTLFVGCVVAGWATLNPGDRSKDRVRRARRAYLYLDAAYGLVPQAGIPLGLALIQSDFTHLNWSGFVIAPLFLIGMVGGMWQYQLTRWKIPMAIFRINGYDAPYPKWWDTFRRGKRRAMWRRCYVWNIVIVSISALLLNVAIGVAAVVVANSAASLHAYAQRLVR